MPSSSCTTLCGTTESRSRLRTAHAYLEVARLVLDERDRDEHLNVSAGLAVLAGIAASDSICCARLRARYRGDDHRGAADLLRRATPDGVELADTLLRLLDLKDEAHYGVLVVAARKARDANRWGHPPGRQSRGGSRAVATRPVPAEPKGRLLHRGRAHGPPRWQVPADPVSWSRADGGLI
jgi:hypothetical protein